MHGAVDHVAGLVDAVVQIAEVGGGENAAVMAHLDQAGGRDLLVHHAVCVDEKGTVFTGHARRNMVGHHVGHAV